MSRKASLSMQERSALAKLPEMQAARALLGTPWSAVEVPSGRITHKSKVRESAWSVPSVLVRHGTSDAVLVFAEAFEDRGTEIFGLRFKSATDNWVEKHVAAARPPFSPVAKFPPGLEVLGTFAEHGPSCGEMGLGAPLFLASETVVPVMWCWFCSGETTLLLFADDQIPMNVGMSVAMTARGEIARVKL